MTMAVCFCALILSQSFSQLARLLVLPLHLLPQHLVGVLQEEDPQPQLILPHPPRVPRLLGRQVVLPSPLPVLVVPGPWPGLGEGRHGGHTLVVGGVLGGPAGAGGGAAPVALPGVGEVWVGGAVLCHPALCLLFYFGL